jgi:enterochelin esterase-like enzyme
MPVSRNRKAHKQKAKARRIEADNRKRHIVNLNKQLQEEMLKAQQPTSYQPVEGPSLTLTGFNPDDENNLPQ